ncbi:EpsG family protein [Enterobacter cloacae]|uniref:EpsG family protein n=1 Tax=Enterobacter cloacae TaxID=550 RepID=UPI0018C21F94|nr:EpsG family protein [Enterobacter cloacae]MBG0521696.1 EpsG family protein [Enterobacter cloacae]
MIKHVYDNSLKDINVGINADKFVRLSFLCLVSIVLFIIAAFRPLGIDNDSLTYESEILAFYRGGGDIKEPVFLVFAFISEVLFDANARVVFILYAFFSIFIKSYAISRYSNNILLSLFIYAGMFFILHDMTQIRVGLASAFFLLAIPDLIKNEKKKYIFKVFLACLCHFSTVILLPLILLSSKKINLSIVFLSPLVMLAAVLLIGDMNPVLISLFKYLPEPLSTKAISYIIGVEQFGRFDDVNIFSKFTLSAFAFFILYLYSCSKSVLLADDIIYLKLFSIMLTLFYMFSSVPVLASRTFELFAVSFIFSLPMIVTKFKPSWIVSCIIFSWVSLYCYLVNLKLIGM